MYIHPLTRGLTLSFMQFYQVRTGQLDQSVRAEVTQLRVNTKPEMSSEVPSFST